MLVHFTYSHEIWQVGLLYRCLQIIKRPARDACLCMGELQAPHFVISRRALAREGDYEMMPVCACVRACVCVCVR